MEMFAKKPTWIGEMFADAPSGAEAINKSLEFKEIAKGEFWIWKKPDTTRLYNNRYIVSLDIGGSAAKADWSVIRVLDRLPMMNGGVPEFVATYRFHMDQDLTAWRAVQVAKYYCDALLVVEANVSTPSKRRVTSRQQYWISYLMYTPTYTIVMTPQRLRRGCLPSMVFGQVRISRRLSPS